MWQTDTKYQRFLNALLNNEKFVCSKHSLAYSYDYVNRLIDVLQQKDWEMNYSVKQRIAQLRESIVELNNRVIRLEEYEVSGNIFGKIDKTADECKINLFFDCIKNEVNLTDGRQKKEHCRIAVFTPLSPLKNGIADYMTEILLALKQYVEIDIYIDDGYEPDNQVILQSFPIYRHHKFHEMYEIYDLILYEIGNNPHHAYIIPYVLQYPGILELHDFRLSHLYTFLSPEYQKIIREKNACAKEPDGRSYDPTNICLLKASQGVLVHNEFSKQEIFNKDMSIDVRKIELFSKVVLERQDTSELIKKYGFEDCFIFSCFGFMNYSKRIAPIIAAFSNLVQKYPQVKFKLLLVGKFNENYLASVMSHIRKRHLKKKVIMTGYVSLNDMYKYISLTDVCMNLRYDYGGESSGTLARIMGMGKACIVNRVGAFDEMPDFCCHKIAYENNPEKEIENITNAMSILFENRAYRKWLAVNSQVYVMEHLNLDRTIQLYCEAFGDFYYNRKIGININCLLKKAASFLAYNYFSNPYYAATYLALKLYSFYCGEYSEG